MWGPADAKMCREESGGARQHVGETETPGPLAPLFRCFVLPLGLPHVHWASQERCVF